MQDEQRNLYFPKPGKKGSFKYIKYAFLIDDLFNHIKCRPMVND